MLGHEFYSYKYNYLTASKTGFPFPEIYELAPGSTIAEATSYEDNETLESYFSRLNYDYLSKYYLSLSFRRMVLHVLTQNIVGEISGRLGLRGE